MINCVLINKSRSSATGVPKLKKKYWVRNKDCLWKTKSFFRLLEIEIHYVFNSDKFLCTVYKTQQSDAEGLKSLTLKVSSKLPEVRVSNFINQKCLVFRPRPELVIKLRKFSDGTFKQKVLMTVVGIFIKIRKFWRHNFDSKYVKERNHKKLWKI